MSAALKARLERLERRRTRRALPRIIMAIMDCPDESIIGYAGDVGGQRVRVFREPGEHNEKLRRRALVSIGSIAIFALYNGGAI